MTKWEPHPHMGSGEDHCPSIQRSEFGWRRQDLHAHARPEYRRCKQSPSRPRRKERLIQLGRRVPKKVEVELGMLQMVAVRTARGLLHAPGESEGEGGERYGGLFEGCSRSWRARVGNAGRAQADSGRCLKKHQVCGLVVIRSQAR